MTMDRQMPQNATLNANTSGELKHFSLIIVHSCTFIGIRTYYMQNEGSWFKMYFVKIQKLEGETL